jgi:hypothetical protein
VYRVLRCAYEALDGEGWADELHVELAEEGGILRDHRVGLADSTEERFHLARRGEGDEKPSGTVAGEGPGVGKVSGGEDGVARAQGAAFGADLDEELAFESVEPLVLMRMDVARWSALGMVGVLDDEELAVSVLGEDLEGDGGDAEVVNFFEAVFARGDGMKRRRGSSER